MMSARSKVSPYDLARLASEYPIVFCAYYDLLTGKKESKDFHARREATREQRIRRAVQR